MDFKYLIQKNYTQEIFRGCIFKDLLDVSSVRYTMEGPDWLEILEVSQDREVLILHFVKIKCYDIILLAVWGIVVISNFQF